MLLLWLAICLGYFISLTNVKAGVTPVTEICLVNCFLYVHSLDYTIKQW
jgi:hypothetical protein